jgi:hypothetical protein
MEIELITYNTPATYNGENRHVMKITPDNSACKIFFQEELFARPKQAKFNDLLRDPAYYIEAIKMAYEAGKNQEELNIKNIENQNIKDSII